MLWLKAKSLIALGITTATRKGPVGASVTAAGGAWVGAEGSTVGVAPPQALKINANNKSIPNHLRFLFMFSSFLILMVCRIRALKSSF